MLSAPHAAQAAPPRVPAYSCGTLASTIGPQQCLADLVHAARASSCSDRRDYYTASPCFKTQAACKAWLYWAQTDWPLVNTFRPCRKGLGY